MLIQSTGGRIPISTQPQHIDQDQSSQKQRSLEQACLAAKIAEDYRGQNTLVLDMSVVTPIFDFFVLSTATSKRQMDAIVVEINRVLKAEGSTRVGIEGRDSESWVLQDYGDIVLHVFTPETRLLYDLEHLWADAEQIDWQSVVARSEVQ